MLEESGARALVCDAALLETALDEGADASPLAHEPGECDRGT